MPTYIMKRENDILDMLVTYFEPILDWILKRIDKYVIKIDEQPEKQEEIELKRVLSDPR